MASTYEQLCDHVRKTGVFQSINCLLGWDERTYLPPSANAFRGEQMAAIAGLCHQRSIDPQIGEWLDELEDSDLAADPTTDTGATLRELRRDYDRLRKLPQELVERLARVAVEAQQTWATARKNEDFSSFSPKLKEILALVCEKADAQGHDGDRYDALLDEYEPGTKTEEIAAVLNDLGAQLQPLVRSIAESGKQAPIEILRRNFPAAEQRTWGLQVAAALGFDFKRGRLDVTDHPFCESMGPSDIRITTRYDEHWFPGAFFGTLHEAGHGIYEQGLPTEAFGLPLGRYVSLGVHESQSRLWENFVGRDRSCWESLFPQAQDVFPAALRDVTLDEFHWAINDVHPSLIRVEADEATYNLHILIRFELERDLVAGQLPVDDLPAAWNEKYQEYLGVTPPNDADGVLQDIHWSSTVLGYFPTYSLGNVYAAQLFQQADREIGGLDRQFSQGQFAPLRQWLRDKVHKQGRRYPAAELMQRVCDRPLSSAPFIDYLTDKLRPLYGLP